ncbi:DUF2231 domain-containing protein [Marmoricola sp. RAF53]|uniref:DUF2231 domain-containing protein n=1 Tax=Marmoricola sp. RAF53 TaxID=3233059 RepID=UPI003F9B1916
MFNLVNGLPVHPLVVHAVVVLLPLAILGTIAIAVRPRWRTRYGHLVVAASAAATVLIPVATSSGESLEQQVGDPGKHAQLGDQLIWFALPLLALDIALVWLARRHEKSPGDRTVTARRTVTVVAALSVLTALAAGVQVYRVGDSGARAAWGDQVASG